MMNIRSFAKDLVNDPQYQQTLRDRARAGTLDPTIEELLLSIADSRDPMPALPLELKAVRTLGLVPRQVDHD